MEVTLLYTSFHLIHIKILWKKNQRDEYRSLQLYDGYVKLKFKNKSLLSVTISKIIL